MAQPPIQLPMPAVEPVPLPVAPATTYREYYSDTGNSPNPDRIQGYLNGYRFTDNGGGGVPTPAALRDLTVTLSDRQPLAFLCLLPGLEGAGGEVTIVHRVVRYMDTPGDDDTGYNDKVLGLLGDILPHQYTVVEVPGTAFHLVGNAVRVPTEGAMNALLPTWEDPATALGPYTEQDPETEVVRPRYLQLVPGTLAALILHRRRVTAKQAYQELVGAIQAAGGLESHADVVVWLRAACTARGGGGIQNTTPSVSHAFTPLYLPREVYSYMTAKVRVDLPGLVGRGNEAGPAAEAIAGALRAFTAARPGTEDGERMAKEPRTIADTYKETYRTLLRYCNVREPDEVAPVWSRLANCHKSEQHTVLTQELQKVCMARALSTELYTPVVTAGLKQMVVGFQFIGHGAEDLSTGCQPFQVVYTGSANHYMALAAASVSHQLAQGEHSASLADYRTIREKEKVRFPRDVTEVSITLHRFAVLCQVLFQGTGGAHPFVEAMWSIAVNIQNLAPFIAERYQGIARLPGVGITYYARILRVVQLSVNDYMQKVAVNTVEGLLGVDMPDFTGMLQDLKRGTFHHSNNWVAIPEEYLDPLPTRGPSTQSSTGSVVASAASTHTTGMSTLTQESTTRASVTRIENTQSDSEFTTLTLRPGGTRNILREHPPPRNDAGHEFCVAWWTRGGCFPNCGRRSTHQPFASAGERTRLLQFVREHLVTNTST